MPTYDTSASLEVSAASTGLLSKTRGGSLGIGFGVVATAEAFAFPQGRAGFTFGTNASAVAYFPYTPGPEGSRPIEAKLYDATGTQVLAILSDRWQLGWQEDFNDTGSAAVTIHKYDPKATEANLASFNIVKFEYNSDETEHDAVFGFRIEKKTLDNVKDGDHAAKVWTLAGRGLLSMTQDAVVYPEYGIERISSKQRNFNFSSKQGPWYVASEWSSSVGVRQDATAGTDWAGYPESWPDPAAEWIWVSYPMTHVANETVFFRHEFTTYSDANVTIFATCDNQADIYLDGDLVIQTSENNDLAWRQKYTYAVTPLRKGPHVIAAQGFNPDRGPAIPAVNVVSSVIPAYATDSNIPYIGVGYTDGALGAYVQPDGSVAGHYGAHAFDGNGSTYWLSVGNYLSWTSDYEYVEGTFSGRSVTAVTVTTVGGPYLCYVSLRNGNGAWYGGQNVPYVRRTVDTNADIPFITYATVGANTTTVIYMYGAYAADRVRLTFHGLSDFGIGKYRWRAGVAEVTVTSESLTPAKNNMAGLIVSVAETDSAGNVLGIITRSTGAWLCKREPRPGWMAQHILHQLMIEAEARGVFGASALTLGFTPTVDSNGIPWNLPRQELSYNIGADVLSVIGSLVETDNFDVWVDAETMTLHAAQKRGVNRAEGPAPLALREGHSLIDFNSETSAPKATRYLVETPWGWTETAAPDQEMRLGRFERLISLGNAASVEQASTQAAAILAFTSKEVTDVSGAHTDSLGPRAYTDYKVGDWILAPDMYGSGLVAYRVLSISTAEDEAGNVTFTPELDKQELEEPQ